jgi:hypothetical protein
MRAFNRCPCSFGSSVSVVSAYNRTRSRNLPPSICQQGAPQALPARSIIAISMPQTPPPCRECPPNCLIFRKILSTLHGFSPSRRLLSISA